MIYLPLHSCQSGAVYRLNSRNLTFGVFNGVDGFIGIRNKFYTRYLFTEFHWDQGEPFGTVKPIEKIQDPVPGVDLVETLDLCRTCQEPVHKVQEAWDHVDDSIAHEAVPMAVRNNALWNILEAHEIAESHSKKFPKVPDHVALCIVSPDEYRQRIHARPASRLPGREVTPGEYSKYQDHLGIARGIHNFYQADGECGLVTSRPR